MSLNWEAAVGSRYEVRCQRHADIHGFQRHGDSVILIGVVDFGPIADGGTRGLVRNWIDGNDVDGNASFDLMELVTGPVRCK